MTESRCRKTQRVIQEQLAHGRRQEVVAAHDLVDLHRGVVHDHRELIGGDPVRATHDEVADRSRVGLDMAADEIDESRRRRRARAEPPSVRPPLPDPALDVGR